MIRIKPFLFICLLTTGSVLITCRVYSAELIQLNYLHYDSFNQAKKSFRTHQNPAYLYQRLYPNGSRSDFNYIGIVVLADWREANKPNFSKNQVWTELHTVAGEAVNTDTQPAQFLVVNEMKVQQGEHARYTELELDYFKPFHQQRVKAGVMNNWQLLRKDFPFGSRHDSDYLTLNGFNHWEDIKKNNPPDIWKNAHGDIDFNVIHDEILSLRDTVNIEIWKLLTPR